MEFNQWQAIDICPKCSFGTVHYRYEMHPNKEDKAEWGQCDWWMCYTIYELIYPKHNSINKNNDVLFVNVERNK